MSSNQTGSVCKCVEKRWSMDGLCE